MTPNDIGSKSGGLSQRIGLQTISWGPWIPDIEKLALETRAIGYFGIEFAQPVSALPPADKLRAILESTPHAFLGLAGGNLADRVGYCGAYRPLYLYSDEWDSAEAQAAWRAGLTVALHPHVFKELESVAKIEPLLEKHDQLKLIVDTAHVHLAGEDPVGLVAKHWDRLIAVHLKDWTDLHGRTSHRFARGFTGLGRGVLSESIAHLLSFLSANCYDGWIVVEQDTSDGDPLASAAASRAWLRAAGF